MYIWSDLLKKDAFYTQKGKKPQSADVIDFIYLFSHKPCNIFVANTADKGECC